MKDKDNELIVIKANELIQKYKYTLTKTGLRVVNTIISNIKSPKFDTEFNIMEFDIAEFCKSLGLKGTGGANYQLLRKTLRDLSNSSSDYIDFGEYQTIVRWIEKPIFEKGSGKVKLKLDDDLVPFLLNASGAIQAKLRYYFEMDSKYSMRLYELLKSWDGYPKIAYEISELRSCIDAMNKSYDHFGSFRKKILDPGISEINGITDLLVSYTIIYEQRKATHIEFTIVKKDSLTQEEQQLSKTPEEPEPFKVNEYGEYIYAFDDPNGTYAACLPKFFTPAQVSMLATLAERHIPYEIGRDTDNVLSIANYLNEKVQLMRSQKTAIKAEKQYAWLRKAVGENWS